MVTNLKGRQPTVPKSTENIIRNQIRKLLRDDYRGNFDKIPLTELGVDSLDFFEMTMILEEEYDIIIPVEQLDSSITLEEIFAMVD